ncbi:efflux RND transporter periplasmic adaptor subunit [Shewanella yunxiaonensis]|uniref:Efflux RND transporter periplasmic adaptor subunit n=1 Tax=Shewanella yunxiaonensis TaxID=2829809 RepID=A0ABX7YVZ8_9GAMM|nr:efflux RND transporter periplasmic adaptor subunit [Shewanella yunxiaonensis]QUN06978.1 efflux RND transporter periplasmic adaptor subunit [Shewanella yunxiaonensis]
MKIPIKIIVLLLVIIGVGVGLVLKKKAQLAAEPMPVITPLVISRVEIRPSKVVLTQSSIAEVLAVHDTVLSSRLTGYVTVLPFFEGDRFKRGALLAKLDMSTSGDVLSQSNSLNTDLAASESAFVAAQEKLRRSKALHELGGISTEQLQFDEAAAAAARVRLEIARENLRNATLVAPFDGIVSQRLAQPGDLATPGKPLLKITDPRAGMRLVVNMPEQVVPVALTAQGRTLPLTSWPEASEQGSRRFEARAVMDGLLPGSRTAVKVVLFSGTGLLIPQGCTVSSNGNRATVMYIKGEKLIPLDLDIQAEGEEGMVTQDPRVNGALACASPDILARLQAGAPFMVGK